MDPSARSPDATEAHRQRLAVLLPLARELRALEPVLLDALAAVDPHSLPIRPPTPRWQRWLASIPALRDWLASEPVAEPATFEQRLEQLQRHRQTLVRMSDRLLVERARSAGAPPHPTLDSLQQDLTNEVRALTAVMEESLEMLDAQLSRLAAQEAHALARQVVGPVADELHAQVVRVRRLTTEGARVSLDDLDRLATEVSLVAPPDAEAEAAEAELASYLRDRTVADAVRRARSGGSS